MQVTSSPDRLSQPLRSSTTEDFHNGLFYMAEAVALPVMWLHSGCFNNNITVIVSMS